jgi:hypothetical protein
MNVSHHKLASGGKVMFTTPSAVPKTSLDIARIPVNAAASSSRRLGVVTSQVPSTGQELSVRSPTVRNVPDAAVKLPSPSVTVQQGIRIKNSSLYVLQKEPRVTYESAFVSHLAKAGVQSATFHQNQTPVLNTAVTVTSPVKDSAPANFEASLPLSCIQSPLRAVLLSPRPNSKVRSTVNKGFVNQNTNSGSVTCTTSTLHLGAAQHVQQNALTPIHTTYLINRSKDPPKLVPLSRFHTMSVPAAGPNQFTRPPQPKTVVSENTTESKTSTLSVSGGSDDDIVEVFSNVHDLNAQKVEWKWMMEIFRGVSCTSRLFLYHADILRQKFERERSAKGRSQIIGKFYRLLKKVLKRLSVQKEHVPKGFSDWLNAEKAKCGIPTTEGGQDSSPIKDKGSDTEVGQEEQLLLDMEITCESDHEDSSDTTTAAQQDLNGCNENLSDSDDDSDDPFSDYESKEQEKVIPVLKPILSYTVREILGDKSTRKLVLHLLREHDSKTANIKSKIISSAEKIQSTDGNEESAAKERECEISKLKTCVHTDVLTEGTSSNSIALLLHSSEHGTGSGMEKEKSVRTEAIVSNGKYVQDLQMKTFSSGTQGKARKEESERRKSAYKKCRVVQASQMETSSNGTEDKAGNEVSGRSKSPYKNSGVVQDSQMETSCSGIEDKAGSEVSGRSKSPYKNSGVVQDSQMETSCSVRSKSPYKNSGVVQDSQMETSCSGRSKSPYKNSGVVQDSQMETSCSGIEDKAGNEVSGRSKSPYKNNGVVQDSQTETSCSGIEDKAGNEVSGRCKSPYKNSGVVQDSQMETSCSGIEDKAGNEVSGRSKSPYKNSGVVQDSQVETSCSGIEDKAGNEVSGKSKSAYKNSGVVEDTQMETSSNGMEGKAGKESERSKSPCKSSVTMSGDANTEVVRDSQVESSLIKTETKTVNEKCDTQEKCQGTKRKYYCVSSTVMPSGMETKRFRTRSALMVSDRLRRNANPVTGFTDLFRSAVQKRLIKPCFVSVVRLNRTN